MEQVGDVLFIGSAIAAGYGLRDYKPNFSNTDNVKAIETSTPWLGVLGIGSGLRHIAFHGSLEKYGGMWKNEGPLFEAEAGMANIAFGVVLLVAHYKKWAVKTKAAVILAYAIYLCGSMLIHIYQMINDQSYSVRHIIIIVMFLSMCYIMFQTSIVTLKN